MDEDDAAALSYAFRWRVSQQTIWGIVVILFGGFENSENKMKGRQMWVDHVLEILCYGDAFIDPFDHALLIRHTLSLEKNGWKKEETGQTAAETKQKDKLFREKSREKGESFCRSRPFVQRQ